WRPRRYDLVVLHAVRDAALGEDPLELGQVLRGGLVPGQRAAAVEVLGAERGERILDALEKLGVGAGDEGVTRRVLGDNALLVAAGDSAAASDRRGVAG